MIPADCHRLLAECLPDLTVTGVRYLAEGWDSTVFEVNDALVVRFPKREDVAQQLEREQRLLPELAPSLPAPIPVFQHVVARCPAAPLGFAGYPKLPGEQLSSLTLSGHKAERLMEQIGRFLEALHRFPVGRARELGALPEHVSGGADSWRRFASETQARVRPLLSTAEQGKLSRWFTDAEKGLFDFTPVLTHSDLGDEHILVNPATGDLTGVIDFGDVAIGDAAVDFTGLLGVFDERMVRRALDAYGRPGDGALLRRSAVYGALSPLHEIRFGLAVADADHVRAGLEGLRAGLLS
jgi:aminoglycoside phosphotransferase (APT) family kinase protein